MLTVLQRIADFTHSQLSAMKKYSMIVFLFFCSRMFTIDIDLCQPCIPLKPSQEAFAERVEKTIFNTWARSSNTQYFVLSIGVQKKNVSFTIRDLFGKQSLFH